MTADSYFFSFIYSINILSTYDVLITKVLKAVDTQMNRFRLLSSGAHSLLGETARKIINAGHTCPSNPGIPMTLGTAKHKMSA